LVGAALDETWSAPTLTSSDAQVLAQDIAQQPVQAAAWIAEKLQGPRSTDTLELLLLDDEGSACTWLTTSTLSDDVVGSLSRSGPAVETTDETARPAMTPTEFFAPTPLESSVQALAPDESSSETQSADADQAEAKDKPAKDKSAKDSGSNKPLVGLFSSKKKKKNTATGTQSPPKRVAVLATHDALARVLLDELDKLGVRVGGAATLWHALCLAWDPRTTRALRAPIIAGGEADPLVQTASAAHGVVGIVCVLSEGRLLWAWSKQGELVAASSQVLRMRVQKEIEEVELEDAPSRSGAPCVLLTNDDIARLIADWLAWSAQLAVAPSHVVCVMPDNLATGAGSLSAGEVGELLTKRWAGSQVDASVVPDPLHATLERAAKVLAGTPRSDTPQRSLSLTALSTRPGKDSRRMHAWVAAAIALLGVGLGVLGARKLGTAKDADKATISWRTSWQGKVKEVFPPASTPPPTITPLMLIEDEIKRREETNTRPDGIEPAKPIMRELELLSLVLASPTVEVLSMSLDTGSVPAVEALVPTTSEAEAVLESLRRIGGSRITNWNMDIQPSGEKRRVRYSGRWQEASQPRSGT
jgi:hypothetical protein